MNIKKKIKEIADTAKYVGKVAAFTSPAWLPAFLGAKSLNLQEIKESVTTEHEQAAWLKLGESSESFYAGYIADLGNTVLGDTTHFNMNVNSNRTI